MKDNISFTIMMKKTKCLRIDFKKCIQYVFGKFELLNTYYQNLGWVQYTAYLQKEDPLVNMSVLPKLTCPLSQRHLSANKTF